jgi:hypothetical protein
MLDLLFVVTTIAFFALMIAYLRACETLGRDRTGGGGERP